MENYSSQQPVTTGTTGKSVGSPSQPSSSVSQSSQSSQSQPVSIRKIADLATLTKGAVVAAKDVDGQNLGYLLVEDNKPLRDRYSGDHTHELKLYARTDQREVIALFVQYSPDRPRTANEEVRIHGGGIEILSQHVAHFQKGGIFQADSQNYAFITQLLQKSQLNDVYMQKKKDPKAGSVPL